MELEVTVLKQDIKEKIWEDPILKAIVAKVFGAKSTDTVERALNSEKEDLRLTSVTVLNAISSYLKIPSSELIEVQMNTGEAIEG